MAQLVESCFGWEVRRYTKENIDGNPLWCSGLLIEDRDACIKAYRSLIKAGVDLLSTPSYQATVPGLMEHYKMSKEKALGIIADSVQVAREAIEQEENEQGKKLDVTVFGVVGSYGAYLHDGSEYTGVYPDIVSFEYLKEWHRERLETLVSTGVQLIWLGLMPRLDEALALVELLKEQPSNITGCLTFSCKEEGFISSGTPWIDAASKAWDASEGRLKAIGFNCCQPEVALKQFHLLHMERPEIPFIAIPNSGEKFDTTNNQWINKDASKSPVEYTEEYLRLGIKYIGCCCRNYSEDVHQMRIRMDNFYKNKNKA